MAYQLKYYKEIESQGNLWRLEILQDKDTAVDAWEIGPVLQGLRLVVQGEQADIDTPIVKTSLEMSFVDAPDLDQMKKCGNWEEFYTSNATEFKVCLYKNGALEWSGYITPDSFSEDLRYRGSVNITARDGLGALQDYEYDAAPNYAGMQNVETLLAKGLRKVSFAMDKIYTYKDDEGARRVLYTDVKPFSQEVWKTQFNNASLEGKTWYEAIESLMYATGMVFRYVGHNSFVFCSLRDLPLYDKQYHWDVPVLDVEFCSYGHRELSPAAKSIVDEVAFELEENLAEVNVPEEAYTDKGTYTYYVEEQVPDKFVSYAMPVNNITSNAWSTMNLNTSLFLNPFEYGLKEGHSSQKNGDLRATDVVYLAANPYESNYNRFALWQGLVNAGKYRFSFHLDTPVALYDNDTKIGFTDYDTQLSTLQYYLRWRSKDGSETLEYRESSKSWVSGVADKYNSVFPTPEQNEQGYPYVFEFPEIEVNKVGTFELEIVGVITYHLADSPTGVSKGSYVQIKDMTLQDVNLENTSIPKSLKVTTKYNEKNNVRIDRKVEYGFNMGRISSPKTVTNGLYVFTDGWYKANDEWVFNAGDTPQPLSVLLHQQLLGYYAKPNNVLTGELATKEPVFNALYQWNGTKHLLTSGTLNILTGRMENAVLREFMRYDTMWETSVDFERFDLDSNANRLRVVVTTKKTLTTDNISCPAWITPELKVNWDGTTIVYLNVAANNTIFPREGVVMIDTALILVKQKAIEGELTSDYSSDYSSDYGM